MKQRLVRKDVVVLLFIVLALGSVAFLSISATFSVQEARVILASRQAIAWAISTAAASLLVLTLLKARRRAVDDRSALETFLQSAGDGIIAIDREFKIILWNQRAEEITGHAAADVIGMPMRDVIAFHRERDRAEDMVFIEEAMLYGEKRTMTEPMYVSRKNGKEIPIGDSAAPMIDDDGNVTGCIIVFRDATQERKQQSLRSEFAYASHQMKTPVTKALWSLEAAMDKPVPEKKDLEVAIGALQSIRKLTKEIVEAAEIDQNVVTLKTGNVLLRDAVAQAEEELERCKEEHTCVIDLSGVPEDLMVYGDPRLVRRVITEVVCNAIIYGKPGATVKVRAESDGDKVTIEVQDEGIGIPDKEQALVFSKFFRGSNLDTTTMAGAGLGMYIAKRYVELLRGHIWFKSIEGQGSIFYISLRPGVPDQAEVADKK